MECTVGGRVFGVKMGWIRWLYTKCMYAGGRFGLWRFNGITVCSVCGSYLCDKLPTARTYCTSNSVPPREYRNLQPFIVLYFISR